MRCSSLNLNERKVGRAAFGLAPCARLWLFQAALLAMILCVVEVSTLKVRTTGSASRWGRIISWMVGYCSCWYRSASSLVFQKLIAGHDSVLCPIPKGSHPQTRPVFLE